MRDDLSPKTWLSCDEMGAILSGDNDASAVVPPGIYYNSVAAMFAYLVPQMTKMGIEVRMPLMMIQAAIVTPWIVDPRSLPASRQPAHPGVGHPRGTVPLRGAD